MCGNCRDSAQSNQWISTTITSGRASRGVPAFRRFVLTYQSEELRQKWIASDIHQRVRGMIENTMSTRDYAVLLYAAV